MRMKVFYATLFAVAVLAAAIYAVGIGSNIVSAHPANTEIECSIPLNVVCEVEDPDGIARITIGALTGQGWVNFVDEDFLCSANTIKTEVGYDPPGGGMVQVTITDCQLKLQGGEQGSPKTDRYIVMHEDINGDEQIGRVRDSGDTATIRPLRDRRDRRDD